jgi:ribonuclease HI
MAFIWILKWIIHEGFFDNPILIKGDSMLVVQQMNDIWRIKDGKYKPYAIEAKELLSNLTNVQIKHIYREQNEEADNLSKAGIRANNIKFRIQPE